MGNTNTQSNKTPVKISDDQIRQNINNLFKNNKANDIASSPLQTLNFNSNLNEPNSFQFGGSKRNRYLQYEQELNNIFQRGGNNNEEGDQLISELSEFDRIKHMLQNGGSYNSYVAHNQFDLPNVLPETPVEPVKSNIASFFKLLHNIKQSGGGNNGNDNDDFGNDNNDNNDNDNNNNNDTNDNNNDNDNNTSSINSDKEDSEDSENSGTVKSDEFSETSYYSESDINVALFYSTTSDTDNLPSHPYIKNRFN